MEKSVVTRVKMAWAVLRGRQTWSDGYPTPWAYEQACKALWRHRDDADGLRVELAKWKAEAAHYDNDRERLRDALERAWYFIGNDARYMSAEDEWAVRTAVEQSVASR